MKIKDPNVLRNEAPTEKAIEVVKEVLHGGRLRKGESHGGLLDLA